MSNEIFIIIAKNIKLMGVWILACERRPISVRRISPPAKVTFWISDKTLFFLFYTIQWLPTSPLRLFVFPIEASAKREWHARVTGDEVQWTMGRMKKRGEATSRPFSRSRLPKDLTLWFHANLSLFPGDSKVSATSPLSPSELLVALHQIEAKSDMKSVMKGTFVSCGWLKVSRLCFEDVVVNELNYYINHSKASVLCL